MSFHVPEEFRCVGSAKDGNNGHFRVPLPGIYSLFVVASDGMGWEHVSVSRRNQVPNWRQMCMVRDMFWDAEDVVVQFHPRKSEYINYHPYCLHLWRPTNQVLPTPPPILVGPR